jgi:excisionase family DNA binding protein
MYRTKEAAEKLGLSQDKVRVLAKQGVIPAKKPGHDRVILNLMYRQAQTEETERGELMARTRPN